MPAIDTDNLMQAIATRRILGLAFLDPRGITPA